MNIKLVAITACFATLQVAAANKYQQFEWERKTFVPFDATTTVTLECPDPAAAKWLAAHYKEWYGESAPKVRGKVAAREDARPPVDARPTVGDEGGDKPPRRDWQGHRHHAHSAVELLRTRLVRPSRTTCRSSVRCVSSATT